MRQAQQTDREIGFPDNPCIDIANRFAFRSFMKFIGFASRWLLRAFLALIVLVALVASVTYFASRQERAATHEFFGFLGDRNYAAAHSMLATSAQNELPLATLRRQFDQVQSFSDISISEANVTWSSASIGGTLSNAQGCTSPFYVTFEGEEITSFWIEKACPAKNNSA